MFQSMATGLGYEVFVRQQKAIMGRPDSQSTLKAIKCPTLLVCGREDLVTPVEGHREMAAAIAGAQLEVIDACGHLSPLEQPEQVTRILGNWLAEIGIKRGDDLGEDVAGAIVQKTE